MHKALVIVPILGWVGVGTLLHQTREWSAVKPDEGVVVVVVPPRPAAASPSAAAPDGLARASDRPALARELHKELQRVGCYEGDISSPWTNTSRQAMRRFTESVNAKLPLEEPDVVLLRLVQGQTQRVCACLAGPAEGARAACAASARAAEAAKKSAGETRREGATQSSTPLIVGAAATSAAAATALVRPEPPSAGLAKPTTTPPGTDNARSPRQSGPTPPADVYPARRRPASRRTESPPVGVQSLVRDVQRALGSFGIR